jgi:hypothetical protein
VANLALRTGTKIKLLKSGENGFGAMKSFQPATKTLSTQTQRHREKPINGNKSLEAIFSASLLSPRLCVEKPIYGCSVFGLYFRFFLQAGRER